MGRGVDQHGRDLSCPPRTEGSPVAPGNEDTLNALRDEDRRPPVRSSSQTI